MKKLTLAALAIAGLMANGSAFAAPADCVAVGDISYLVGLGSTGCLQQDKIWSNFVVTLNDTPVADASVLGIFSLTKANGLDTHGLNLTFTNPPINGAGYGIAYDIGVEPTAAGLGFVFLSASAGTTFTNGTGTFTATFNGTPVNTNGGTITTGVVGTTLVHVTHTSTSAAGGQITQFSDSFQEFNPTTNVPEIDALAGTGALTLLAGALALAGERRRRAA